jgi:hypothetical protein
LLAEPATGLTERERERLAVLAESVAAHLCADAREVRRAQTREGVAPRQGGEPIMAIASINSRQVTFYDADGWILRAPVSTGTTEYETPAGVFAIVQKKKDHRSNMYDVACCRTCSASPGTASRCTADLYLAMRLRTAACGYLSVLRKGSSTRRGSECG